MKNIIMKFNRIILMSIGVLGLIVSLFNIFKGNASVDNHIVGIIGSVYLIWFSITIKKHIKQLPNKETFGEDNNGTKR